VPIDRCAEQEGRCPRRRKSKRADDIQQQIRQLSGCDLQLWSIGILVILTLTAGLLAFITPNLMWAQRVVRIAHAYLPQLVYGLIPLIVLFNIYLLSRRESLSLMNPLTQLPKSGAR
jgi:hypothetical protein